MTAMNDPAGRRPPARAFVEKSLQAERNGDEDKAEYLMEQAEKVDPDETIAVLQEAASGPASEHRQTPAPPRSRDTTRGNGA